ncbi:MAG: hypothetical protein UU65_C0005G0054 [candidate division CPR2 bacterium GW2011_GWC1_41_48]|uniref:Uncharacterized protein n=1 Tax=candidate division CPR2 bacterium GW2011_GWC1_41_48 TaxID=1618344 RepID=A0A0G0Z6V0_UNCC2|nr:MAG: hypothetical protein UT47_C0005G0054 [candidate division CPR2 bacterium GW2011_GWC2_39_35]KKR27606.1 MAG: hypothetical protein UT59_C0052G0003 [candidate division CPR2 bacterium GW2011_GWD1_39_7]KKR28246.1 MAG: hypothetical protein UT60_C0024G0005 [candidate division CPR2 bacterium GW2011_GWD2_39_7]KKS08743.1 MAG: hypothetical protein UU65_C0005G0054 [candidate division CPR2 bacterium GW2011_GWC1_41_48]
MEKDILDIYDDFDKEFFEKVLTATETEDEAEDWMDCS